MDKYKIGEIVHLMIKEEIDGKIEEGTIIFEYLGRGLNGLNRLKLNEKYICIEEEEDKVKLMSWYIEEKDPVAHANNVNEYREMIGRVIHMYGISDENINKFVDFMDMDYMDFYVDTWIMDADIQMIDGYNIIRNTKDENMISQLMDEYKKKPLTKEQEDEIIKNKNNNSLSFGKMIDVNGNVVPVVYFGDGSNKNKIHTYHTIGNQLVIHPNQLNDETRVLAGLDMDVIQNEINRSILIGSI